MTFKKLINEYDSLKDELMEYDSRFHDNIFWDMTGYCEDYEEFHFNDDQEDLQGLLKDLEKQVKACRQLLQGFQNLNYIYS